jgi:hypothetical protein
MKKLRHHMFRDKIRIFLPSPTHNDEHSGDDRKEHVINFLSRNAPFIVGCISDDEQKRGTGNLLLMEGEGVRSCFLLSHPFTRPDREG